MGPKGIVFRLNRNPGLPEYKIERAIQTASYQTFFNDFATKILFNSEDPDPVELCRQKLKTVAFVQVEMVRTDSVVLTREIYSSISIVTTVGGILSLHNGVSMLSVVEVAYWILKLALQFILWLMRTLVKKVLRAYSQ